MVNLSEETKNKILDLLSNCDDVLFFEYKYVKRIIINNNSAILKYVLFFDKRNYCSIFYLSYDDNFYYKLNQYSEFFSEKQFISFLKNKCLW